jgi:hypothetical protein
VGRPVLLALLVATVGCASLDGLVGGSDDGGHAEDVATTIDASGGVNVDAATPADPGDSGMTRPPDTGTASDAANDSAQAPDSPITLPDAGSFSCGLVHVPTCDQCPNKPQPCVGCDRFGGTVEFLCVTAGDLCDAHFSGTNGPCPCSTPNPAKCPLATQTCVADECRTCGENGSNIKLCKNLLTCQASTGKCLMGN